MSKMLRLPALCEIPILLLALSGCRIEQGPAAVCHPTTCPATQADRHEASLTVEQIKTALTDLPAWPAERRDFSPREWLRILVFARDLQKTDPEIVLKALTEYVRQYYLPYDGPASPVEEWSKVYVLLRVIFNVPSESYDERKHTLPPVSGGGFVEAYASKRAADNASELLSKPLLWTAKGPRLLSKRAGYSGAPYRVGYEWSQFQAHYPYRELDAVVELFRSRVENRGVRSHFQ